MVQTVHKPPARRTGRAREKERQELLRALSHTRALIQQAYGGSTPPATADLIESYVFEINALQARYNYLIRQVKALEGGL